MDNEKKKRNSYRGDTLQGTKKLLAVMNNERTTAVSFFSSTSSSNNRYFFLSRRRCDEFSQVLEILVVAASNISNDPNDATMESRRTSWLKRRVQRRDTLDRLHLTRLHRFASFFPSYCPSCLFVFFFFLLDKYSSFGHDEGIALLEIGAYQMEKGSSLWRIKIRFSNDRLK